MAIQREILAKSVLTKSGISDYAVNCLMVDEIARSVGLGSVEFV